MTKWFSQCSMTTILFSLGLPIVKPTTVLTFDRVAVKEQYFTELRWLHTKFHISSIKGVRPMIKMVIVGAWQ